MTKDMHPAWKDLFLKAYQSLEEIPLSFDLDERALQLSMQLAPFLKERPEQRTSAWCLAFLIERQLKATRDFIDFNKKTNHIIVSHQEDFVRRRQELCEMYDKKALTIVFLKINFFWKC